ncbi:unnamed protein product [Meloidogyne enterolobii]|uniref:Uncharacterized protein n=1 Tax=Meloidogyne enterolobii TaxID=390850 RepID=A0ACB0ZHQ9_MELEN
MKIIVSKVIVFSKVIPATLKATSTLKIHTEELFEGGELIEKIRYTAKKYI